MYVKACLFAVFVLPFQAVIADCERTLFDTSADVHSACVRSLMPDMQCDMWLLDIARMQNDQKIMDEVSSAVLQYQDDFAKKTKIKTLRLEK